MPQEEKPRDRPTDDQSPPQKGPSICSLRYGLCLLLHFCNVITLSQYMCLSLTMVDMVNITEPRGLPNASVEGPPDSAKNPKYNWSPNTQGVILSSVLYGVLIAQIPTGYLSSIVSVRKMIGCSLLLSSLLNLLVPLMAAAGEAFIIACRTLQGLSQGTVMTAQHVIWVKWAPPLERGRLTSMSLSGKMLGPFIVLLTTGFICPSLGWPMAFYIFGTCGCALSLVWFLLFYDDPTEHPHISPAERDFIVSSLAGQVSSSGHAPPIGAMLRSLPLWVISFSCFAFSWTLQILFFYLPTFIRAKLNVEVQENGLLSGLPYLFSWILSLLVGPMADFLRARNILSTILVRKLFTTLGLLLPAIFSMCLAYAGSSRQSIVAFLVLASAAQSFCVVGMLLNPLDIAPRYYGFLKSMTFLIGMMGGLISSTVAGIILDQDPESSWFKIFFLMAAINVMSLILYLIFAKAEIQDWAKERQLTRL